MEQEVAELTEVITLFALSARLGMQSAIDHCVRKLPERLTVSLASATEFHRDRGSGLLESTCQRCPTMELTEGVSSFILSGDNQEY